MKQELKEFIQEAKRVRKEYRYYDLHQLLSFYDQMLERLEAMEKQTPIVVRFDSTYVPEGLKDEDAKDFDNQKWVAWFEHPDLKGTLVSGKDKQTVWNELMVSFQVMVAHWSGIKKEDLKLLTPQTK